MKKTYDPEAIEQRWYAYWEERGKFAPSGDGEAYCVMIPPPNVTGSLHMGHAFQDTLMDTLIRYQRMQGSNTLWQVGTDHAGIATQMVVERQLNAEGRSRTELGRERFVERVWQWRESSGGTITRQLRRMGASVDWSRERFTMDEGLSRAVIEVFVKLYDEGLIYRGKRLVNWDPVLHTALSDLEVISAEENGQLWHFRYPLVDSNDYVVIATTRPETMLGDTAVAVHPDDERYRHLHGQRIKLPLTGRVIPIIADDYVDPDFGSGCVKITPGHDFNDYEIGERHALTMLNIFTQDAHLSQNAPEPYRGLDRFEARRQVVADMETAGLVEKIEAHKLTIPRGDRSGAVVEPFLTDQWYMKMQPLAEPAIAAVEDERIRFVPDNWKNTYFEWMRNIQDWCISRQLWWGHRIPAWYDAEDNIYVGRSEAQVREKYAARLGPNTPLSRDEDVLDTWFSSALWPFSTLGWPEATPDLETFYPTSVLVTGFDIIFFWVARMIMMGLKLTSNVPFHEVYVHALIRDADGQKMSKSKGNVLDPIDLIDGIDLEALVSKRITGLMQPRMAKQIEQRTRKEFPHGIPAFGTDALRFTFAALASPGRDIRFDLDRIEGYRNFCNKLWNAARYVLMNIEGQALDTSCEQELGLAERWIYSRLSHTVTDIQHHFRTYRFDLAAKSVYELVWNGYCDWYLELSKPALREASPARRAGTRHTLVNVLEMLLRLLHPMMPFITEDLWQRTAPIMGIEDDTLMWRPFPSSADLRQDDSAEQEMQWLMGFILGLRRIRGEMDIAPTRPLPVLLVGADSEDTARLERNRTYLDSLARIESITMLTDAEEAPQAATALLGDMKILVPMAGLIDVEAEIERLSRQMRNLKNDLAQNENKLANDNFVTRAPEPVVNKAKNRVKETKQALGQLESQMEKIEQLRTAG